MSRNCDRCDANIFEKKWAVVNGVRSPDDDGDGKVTETAELCARCYRAVWKFVGITPVMPRRRRS